MSTYKIALMLLACCVLVALYAYRASVMGAARAESPAPEVTFDTFELIPKGGWTIYVGERYRYEFVEVPEVRGQSIDAASIDRVVEKVNEACSRGGRLVQCIPEASGFIVERQREDD